MPADDMQFFGVTGLEDIDWWSGLVSEDDGTLDLSHGDVLCVVLPVELLARIDRRRGLNGCRRGWGHQWRSL